MKLRNKKTGELRDGVAVFCNCGLDCDYKNVKYSSIAELNEDWEDCKPAEPLIKDEKIRKAVRAWAEAMAIVCAERFDGTTIAATNDQAYISFDVDESAFNDVPFGRNLTITELCGEEEECNPEKQ